MDICTYFKENPEIFLATPTSRAINILIRLLSLAAPSANVTHRNLKVTRMEMTFKHIILF